MASPSRFAKCLYTTTKKTIHAACYIPYRRTDRYVCIYVPTWFTECGFLIYRHVIVWTFILGIACLWSGILGVVSFCGMQSTISHGGYLNVLWTDSFYKLYYIVNVLKVFAQIVFTWLIGIWDVVWISWN